MKRWSVFFSWSQRNVRRECLHANGECQTLLLFTRCPKNFRLENRDSEYFWLVSCCALLWAAFTSIENWSQITRISVLSKVYHKTSNQYLVFCSLIRSILHSFLAPRDFSLNWISGEILDIPASCSLRFLLQREILNSFYGWTSNTLDVEQTSPLARSLNFLQIFCWRGKNNYSKDSYILCLLLT